MMQLMLWSFDEVHVGFEIKGRSGLMIYVGMGHWQRALLDESCA